MAFITTTANSISSGGTISGDITIAGDLTVQGSATNTFDEQIQGIVQILGSTGTGATPAGTLQLTTSETTIVDNDQLGRIEFLAASEADGSDSQLVGASIAGEAEATFAADNNSTALVFSTNTSAAATERMRITSAGLVGIGATPILPLTVQGASGNIANFTNGNNSLVAYVDNSNVQIANNTTLDAEKINMSTANNAIEFYQGGSEKMRLNSTGLGIGNANPVDLLHVGAGADSPAVDSVAIFTHTGTTNVAIRDASSDVELLNYAYSGGGLIGTVTNHDLSIRTNNTNRLTITSGGSVGIGTASPVATMDIVGTRTLNLTNTISDDTNKNAVITHSQYDSGTETEGFMLMQGFSNSSTNRIDIGGGNSQHQIQQLLLVQKEWLLTALAMLVSA